MYSRLKNLNLVDKYFNTFQHFWIFSRHFICLLKKTHNTAINKHSRLVGNHLFTEFYCRQCYTAIIVMGGSLYLLLQKNSEIVTLHKDIFSEHELNFTWNVNKTANHKSVSKFKISWKFSGHKSNCPRSI